MSSSFPRFQKTPRLVSAYFLHGKGAGTRWWLWRRSAHLHLLTFTRFLTKQPDGNLVRYWLTHTSDIFCCHPFKLQPVRWQARNWQWTTVHHWHTSSFRAGHFLVLFSGKSKIHKFFAFLSNVVRPKKSSSSNFLFSQNFPKSYTFNVDVNDYDFVCDSHGYEKELVFTLFWMEQRTRNGKFGEMFALKRTAGHNFVALNIQKNWANMLHC